MVLLKFKCGQTHILEFREDFVQEIGFDCHPNCGGYCWHVTLSEFRGILLFQGPCKMAPIKQPIMGCKLAKCPKALGTKKHDWLNMKTLPSFVTTKNAQFKWANKNKKSFQAKTNKPSFQRESQDKWSSIIVIWWPWKMMKPLQWRPIPGGLQQCHWPLSPNGRGSRVTGKGPKKKCIPSPKHPLESKSWTGVSNVVDEFFPPCWIARGT